MILAIISKPTTGLEISTNQSDILQINTIDHVKVFCRKYTIQYDFDNKNMYELRNKFFTSISLMERICRTIRSDHLCISTLRELKFLLNKYETKVSYIKNFDTQKMDKRSIKKISSIIRKTISLSETSYNDLKRGLSEMQTIINSLSKNLNRVQEHLDYMNFASLTEYTNINLQNSIHICNSIIDIFTNKNYAKIIDLLKLEDIKQDLSIIQKQATNESCSLPINLNPLNFIHLLKIMDITPKKSQEYLTLNIEIPTTFGTTFQLMEAIPIPFMYEKKAYEIKPLFDMYLVHRNAYVNMFSIPFTLEDKINCVDLNSHKLCYPKSSLQITDIMPAQNLFLPDYDFCNQKDKGTIEKILRVDKKCNLIQVSSFNKIIMLTDKIFYIFISTPTVLTINCQGKEQVRAFNSSVLISQLDPKCSLKMEQAFNRDNNNIQINRQKIDSEPINSVSDSELIQKENKHYVFKNTRDLQSDFSDMLEQADELYDDTTTEITLKPISHNVGFPYWYITWVLIVVVSIYAFVKLLWWCENRQIQIHNFFLYLYYCLCARKPPTNGPPTNV